MTTTTMMIRIDDKLANADGFSKWFYFIVFG